MSRRFAEISFTPSVRAVQTRYGLRKAYAGLEDHDQTPDKIGPVETAFIAARDGFYQATTNGDGWPYVQYRGGARGSCGCWMNRPLIMPISVEMSNISALAIWRKMIKLL